MTTVIEHARDSRTPLRSDLSPADALALSCLVYVDFHALPGPRSPRGCLLREVAQASSIPSLYHYSLVSHADRQLLEAAGASARFGGLRVRDAVTRLTSGRSLSSVPSPSSTRPGRPTWSSAGPMQARLGGRRMPALVLIFQRIRSSGQPTTWHMRHRGPRGRLLWPVIRRARTWRCTRLRPPLPRRLSASMRLIPWDFLRQSFTMDFSRASTGSCTST